MIQNIIVIIIVALAAVYAANRIIKSVRNRVGSSCAGCESQCDLGKLAETKDSSHFVKIEIKENI